MVGQILSGEGTSFLSELLKSLKNKKDVTDLTSMNDALLVNNDAITQISDSIKQVAPGQSNASYSSVSAHNNSSVMSGNFVSSYGLSKSSTSASVKGMRARKNVEYQAKNRINSLLDELGGISVGEDVHPAEAMAWYQQRVNRIKNADNFEGHEDTLRKAKKHIEDKAQEAMQPKDENGKPIEELVTEGALIEEASPPTIDVGTSSPVLGSEEILDTGNLAPVLDTGESVSVESPVGANASTGEQQHIDIHI